MRLRLAIGFLFVSLSVAVTASAESYFDPYLAQQNGFCWDGTSYVDSTDLYGGGGIGGGTSGGGGTTTTEEKCVTVKDYNTCVSKCDCTWRNNKNKCKSGLTCLDIANSEHDACLGNCITDWS